MGENVLNKPTNTVAQSDEDIIDLTCKVKTKPGEAVFTSSEQIEAAVEKALKKIFTAKIEAIIMDVIEKTVKKEIEKINALIEELADNEK